MSNRPTFPADHTPAEWREMATKARQQSADSFQRCDTDGFLSQWASDQMATRYDRLADIAANGGKSDFQALTDLEGNLMDARYIETRYGWSWAITTQGGTVWFNESQARNGARRRAAHERKGYRIVTVRCPAVMWNDGRVTPDQNSDDIHIVGEIDYPNW
jgi:hypothetical protein